MQKKKEINIELGRRIQTARELRGYTQEQLAEKLDVGVQHISNIERGVTGISLTALSRVCMLLDVSADFLLFGSERPSSFHTIDDKIHALPPQQAKLVASSFEALLSVLQDK